MSYSLSKLTSRLWVAQSEFYFTNSGIFINEGQACIIDPGIFPKEIKAISNFLNEEKVSPQVIVITHGHWDHVLGPEHFPGISVVTQANYLDKTSRKYGARIRRQIDEWESSHGIAREQQFVIPLPAKTFDEKMSLTLGNLSIDLIHAPGHAADQLVVYQVESRTLWAADMLSDIEMPYVCGNLAEYERTLKMLSTFDIRILAPGHGHTTRVLVDIQTRIAKDKEYLAELRDKVEQAIHEGKTIEETVLYCKDMQHPLLKGNEGSHRLNVESVFLEFGGKADATKLGWSQFVNNV